MAIVAATVIVSVGVLFFVSRLATNLIQVPPVMLLLSFIEGSSKRIFFYQLFAFRDLLQPQVHVHIKRHSMKDFPEIDDAVAQWCMDMFAFKDKLLGMYVAENTFSDQPLQNFGRPVKSLVVVVVWACLLIFGALKFCRWTLLLSSWKGLMISAVGLAVVTVLVYIMIQISQPECSTPARVASSKHRSGDQPFWHNAR